MGVLTLSLLTLIVGAFIYFVVQRWRHLNLIKKLGYSGPKPHFIFGNLYDMYVALQKEGEEYGPYFTPKMIKKYGDTFAFMMGAYFNVITVDPVTIEDAYIKQFSCFTDRESNTFLTVYPMYESLLQIPKDGPHGYGWKEIRSIVSPTFTTGKMKEMHKIIHERVLTLIDILAEKSSEGSIDVYDEFQALTLDVIGRTAFGIECDCLHDKSDEFYVNCRDFFYNFSFEKSPAIGIATVFPILGPLLRPFATTAKAQRLLASNLEKVILDRKNNFDTFNKIDTIQLILQQDLERQKKENKAPMHIDTIVSNCYGFLLAGYETTSTALTYTAYLLATHPDIQEKLFNEIQEKIGDSEATYDVVMKLPYLDAVYRESLRIKPPVLDFSGRECVKETVVNGHKFLPGMRITVSINAIHWDERYWPDPEKFDPERFTDGKVIAPFTWIPFGIGPRNCVGMRFAEMEIKFTIVEMVRKIKLEVTEKTEIPIKSIVNLILMRPMGKVFLKISPR